MTVLFKALGALLAYPSAELVAALAEIRRLIESERGLGSAQRGELLLLLDELARGDLLDLQERYVALFDRGRKTSLHLFEHVHGDSRARGQAMVDLARLYADAGFALAVHELPDYLPAVLEFVAFHPAATEEILGDCAHIVRAIGEALREQGSAYSAVPAALLRLIGEPGLARSRSAEQVDAVPEKSLDEEWGEEPVFFGPPGGGGCGGAKPSAAVVRFMPRQS